MSQPPAFSSPASSSFPMVDPLAPLRQRVLAVAAAQFGDDGAAAEAALHRSAHADYQADIALGLARRIKRNPKEVGAALAAGLSPDDVIARAEVSGPGFINITLQPTYLASELGRMLTDDRLGSPPVPNPETVVVDYSSPNLAKEMHVGHIRSTIIGDALARLLEFQGHRVVRQNHVGDWGTPFGMLLEQLIDARAKGGEASVRELVGFYREARAKFDSDPEFAERARRRVVLLQGGETETLALWRRLIDISIDYFSALYTRLGVSLRPQDVAGESRYNPELPNVVQDLVKLGLAVESDGAMCVFPPGFLGREGEALPLIVRKQDGGYGYATTDLAALRHRVGSLGATRVIYVVGAPQTQHLAMVFAAARMAGWAGENVRLEHVAFGSVLGPDKKMFKTRAGESVSLAALIDEAIDRAGQVVREKSPDLDPAEQVRIAAAVGVGAIKYADMSNDRIKDYVFDWNRMLAFEGNTAPYLMYAHARVRSILRKAEWNGDRAAAAKALQIEAPEERALALELLGLAAAIDKTGETLQPHRICAQLYDVATKFMGFYEKCPVLKAVEPARSARVALAALTARVLEQGLGLLGITAPEQM
jgi:arginyl-tRNA synthetase